MMSIFPVCGHLKTLTQTNLNFTSRCQKPSEKEKKKHNTVNPLRLTSEARVCSGNRQRYSTWSCCCPWHPHVSRTQPSTHLQLIRLFYLLSSFFHQRIHTLKLWQKSEESADCRRNSANEAAQTSLVGVAKMGMCSAKATNLSL